MTTYSPLPLEPSVQVLSDALREHNLLADVQVLFFGGEPDVRLVACRDGDVTVELLAVPADTPTSDRWHAVRVQGDERQVWEGPRRGAPPGEVVCFVEVLLVGGPAPVDYSLLG